jgi:hypothetical protein
MKIVNFALHNKLMSKILIHLFRVNVFQDEARVTDNQLLITDYRLLITDY